MESMQRNDVIRLAALVTEAIGAGTHNIYTVNTSTGAVTTVFTNYSGTTSAALAMRPSDGIIFFALNVTNGAVFTWNPATPATAPVQIGTTGAAIAAPDIFKNFLRSMSLSCFVDGKFNSCAGLKAGGRSRRCLPARRS